MGLSITGYLLPSSLGESFTLLDATRPVVRHMRDEKLSRVIAKRLAHHVDEHWLAGRPQQMPLRTILGQVSEERREIIKGTRHPDVDTTMSLVLFAHPKGTLVLINTDTPSWCSLIASLPGAQDVSYWDGECPSDLEQDAWDERQAMWKNAMAPDWVPANHGLIFTYNDRHAYPDLDALIKVLPSLEDRALEQAKQAFMRDWIDAYSVTNPNKGSFPMSYFSEGYFSMSKPENMQTIEAAAKTLASQLPELTPDLLENGWS